MFMEIDFEEPGQSLMNQVIKTYLQQSNIEKSVQELRTLLKQKRIVDQSIETTDKQIEKTRYDADRLLQSIKGLSTNKVLIKTSKVLDQFMKDLRECEVKI